MSTNSEKFKKAIDAAKALLNFAKEEKPKETAAFATAKVKDGESVVSYENTEVGTAVTVDEVPAPDGELILDNGWTFIIKDGKIESATKAEKAVEEQAVETPPAAEGAVTLEMYNTLLARVEALEGAQGKFATQLEAVPSVEQIQAFTGTLGDFVTELEKVPTQKTAEQEFSNEEVHFTAGLEHLAASLVEQSGK